MSTIPALKLWLIDCNELFRVGLRKIIESRNGHRVVDECGSAEEAVERASEIDCDVVVLDLALPGADGVWLLEALRESELQPPTLVLSAPLEEQTVLRALQADALGCLVKSASQAELFTALEIVAAGGTYLHAAVTPTVLQNFQGKNSSDPLNGLEERDLRILQCLAKGMSNRQIAESEYLSVSTVKSRLRRMFEWMNVTDRASLVFEAMNRGLLKPNDG